MLTWILIELYCLLDRPMLEKAIKIERSSRTSLRLQIKGQIRNHILQGRFLDGKRLPPTRILAKQLGVNCSTVVSAYNELLADGLGECRYRSYRTGVKRKTAYRPPQQYAGSNRPPSSLPVRISWPASGKNPGILLTKTKYHVVCPKKVLLSLFGLEYAKRRLLYMVQIKKRIELP